MNTQSTLQTASITGYEVYSLLKLMVDAADGVVPSSMSLRDVYLEAKSNIAALTTDLHNHEVYDDDGRRITSLDASTLLIYIGGKTGDENTTISSVRPPKFNL